jgi:hypothetical protein
VGQQVETIAPSTKPRLGLAYVITRQKLEQSTMKVSYYESGIGQLSEVDIFMMQSV